MATTQRMNVRYASDLPSRLAPSHSFLGGGDKQSVELLANEDRTTPPASPARRWTERLCVPKTLSELMT
jgi:hypothetical protein